MSKVAILIINYNTYEKTEECIELIRQKTSLDYHIYLLENGSQNDSDVQLKKRYENSKDVTLIISKENFGYARGNNLILKKAIEDNNEFAVIMNNDIFLINNAIDIMINDLENDSEVSFVGPHMIGTKGELQLTAKNERPTFRQYICRETFIGRLTPRNQLAWLEWQEKQKTKCKVYWLSGAIFAVRMKDFKKIDFFDPFTFLYYEEYIIAEKAKKANCQLQYEPVAKVLHQHGGSTKLGLNLKTRTENIRSELYFIRKYMKWNKSIQIILFFIRTMETYLFWRNDPEIWNALKKYIGFSVRQLRGGTMAR